MATWAALVSPVAMFIEAIWAVSITPRTLSGRHSSRAIRKPARRPVIHAHPRMMMPPTRKRIAARRSGGASSSPILIAMGLTPQNREASSASAAPRRSIGT